MQHKPEQTLRLNRSPGTGFSAFTLNVLLVIMVISGLAVLPYLSVKLNPTSTLPSLTVSFYWPGASSRLIEMEVTTRLEGAFSTLKGVRNIHSRSGNGQGSISVEFDRFTNMDYARFEIAGLVRQFYPVFPEGVSWPVISMNRPDDESEVQILAYTLNANASAHFISRYAEKNIRMALSLIEGVHEVRIYGSTPFAWRLSYDHEKLRSLGMDPSHIKQALLKHMQVQELGHAEESDGFYEFLLLKTGMSDTLSWEEIPVARTGGKIIRLGELGRIRYSSMEPVSHFRVNGLNAVNLVIYAEKQANHLALASRIKSVLSELSQHFPPGYTLVNSYDSTLFLKSELMKIAFRTLFSIVFLLTFVLIISRNFRYLMVIAISLFSNLAVACIFYYLAGLEIHLYTLAGITVSLGIIIDNTLVMADHIRYQRNRKAFIAILAATLTTVAALTAIFFLDENLRLNLIDFARVLIINLLVSLAIAMVFLPAVMDKIPLMQRNRISRFYRLRRVSRWNGIYRKSLVFALKTRWVWLLFVILGFGLPVDKLPDHVPGEHFFARLYNYTLGDSFFGHQLKPLLYKTTGGALRLFSLHVYDRYYYNTPSRTTLHVNVLMPDGATLEQMNEVFIDLERFVAPYHEVEQYQTHIRSPQRGSMIIYFKREFETGTFPYTLKSELEQYAVFSGGAEYTIFGVGRAFSNVFYTGFTNSAVVLTGYNYDELTDHARTLREKILEHPRVNEVYIRADDSWYNADVVDLRYLELDASRLPGGPGSLLPAYSSLLNLSRDPSPFTYFPGNESFEPVVVESEESRNFDIWDLYHYPLTAPDGNLFKIGPLAVLRMEKGDDLVVKKNQQYVLTLAYDFIGPDKLAYTMEDSMVNQANRVLPIGYKASHRDYYYRFRQEGKQYWLIPLIVVMVYFICAILLESFTRPLAVIALVPVSFIGVFLTFYIFGLSFDQGGFASFLLLCGLTVNSSLYILNQFSILERKERRLEKLDLYLKAFHAKIIPIFLTTLSTMVGLIPFLLGGQNEVFWFALAAGTIGGLLFSMPAVIFFLPLLMKNILKKDEKAHTTVV